MDIETPIAQVGDRCCEYYDGAYFEAARKSTDPSVSALFRSLGIICSFFPQYSNLAQPYRPAIIDGNKRSLIPTDLSEADLATVERLLPLAKDPALRARLADVLWLRKKGAHEAARAAVGDYIAAAERLLKPHGWIHAVELLIRALQLGAQLGRKNEPYKNAEKVVLANIENKELATEPYFLAHLLPIARDFRLGQAVQLAGVARSQADAAQAKKDHRPQRIYLSLEADFHHMAENLEAEERIRREIAETYIEEADTNATRATPSYFAASDSLAKGIEALRQAQGEPDRIRELKQRLRDYQKRSMAEMKGFNIPVDFSKEAGAVADYVSKEDFKRAMVLLSLGMNIVNVAKLREQVLETIRSAPLTHLIGGSLVDSQGRPIAHKEPLLDLESEDAKRELENRMFEHAAQFDWRVRAQAFIQPARLQIWKQHRPRMKDLEYLVVNNPFIPPGHEGLFLQGLYYGLAGDFVMASHLLTPQIENSIRYVVEQNGGDVTNLHSDLTQPVKTLGPLFDVPETNETFGDDLCFELRGILIEKHGYSFRNNLAHGFVTEADCYSEAAINTWWLVLSIFHRTMVLPGDMAEKDGTESGADALAENTSERSNDRSKL